MNTNSETAIWERVIKPGDADLTQDVAQFILRLDFRDEDHERMAELAQRSNDGTLNPAERAELENYVRVGNVLALMQSKARLSLRSMAKAS